MSAEARPQASDFTNATADVDGAIFGVALLDYRFAGVLGPGEYDYDPGTSFLIFGDLDEAIRQATLARIQADGELDADKAAGRWYEAPLEELETPPYYDGPARLKYEDFDIYVFAFHRSMSEENIRRQLWTTIFTSEDDRRDIGPVYRWWRCRDEIAEDRRSPVKLAFAGYRPPFRRAFAWDDGFVDRKVEGR